MTLDESLISVLYLFKLGTVNEEGLKVGGCFRRTKTSETSRSCTYPTDKLFQKVLNHLQRIK